MAAGPAMVNRVYCLVYKQSGKPFSLFMMAGERWYFSCSHKKSTQKNGHKGALPLMDPPGHSGACCYRPARGNFVVSARCPAGLPRPGLVLEIPCPSCKGAWPGDIWWFVRRGGLWPPAAPVPRPPSPGGSVQKGGPQSPFGLVVLRGDCQEGEIEIPLLTVSFGSFLHEQKRTSPVPKRRGRIAAPACAPFRNDRAGGSPMHSRAGR